jgi:hypothetical protein
MRTFLLKLSFFLTVIAVFLTITFRRYASQWPVEKSFYMASRDKHARLANLPSPRLILVGGSSMGFGIDSRLLGTTLGFQTVNMGLNHGVGLEFMLQEVEPFVRRGDVILLSPEYTTIEQFYRSDPEYIARLLECRPSLVRALSKRQRKDLLDHGFVQHVGRVIRYSFRRIQDSDGDSEYLHTRRSSFNEMGDVVSHHNLPRRELGAAAFKFASSPVAFQAVEHLNRFHDACRRRGAQVFYSHPPYQRKSFERNRDSILKLDAFLREQMQIPMLDSVEELVFPNDWFFDTEYHLTLEGKLQRTAFVAQRLRARIGPPTSPQ